MTTLALLHTLNSGRQECVEIGSRGVAINQGIGNAKKMAAKTNAGIFFAIKAVVTFQ